VLVKGLVGDSVFACYCNLSRHRIKVGLLVVDDPALEHQIVQLSGIDRPCQIQVKLPGDTGVLVDQVLEVIDVPDSVG
jgi:hypothetical protein